MHPAKSVIFFTVTSGLGYGVLMMLALANLLGLNDGASDAQLRWVLGAGLVFVTAGLCSSTFHLANPKNAWRSWMRFRTSWLSREAVLAVAVYPLALLWLFAPQNAVLGLLVAVLSLATVYSTGMIYACLKTIRQWHSPLTPANYVVLSAMSGAVALPLFLTLAGFAAHTTLLQLALLLLLVGAVLKIVYFRWSGETSGSTINTATGLTRGTVKLLDTGHSAGTFLTDEFGYDLARSRQRLSRSASLLLGFALPLLFLGAGLKEAPSIALMVLALLSMYGGLLLERWLFFAEATHVVRLYHGQARA